MEEDIGLSFEDKAPEPAPSPEEDTEGLSLGEGAKPEAGEDKPKEVQQPDDIPEKYELNEEDEAFSDAVGKVAGELGIGQERLQKLVDAVDTARDDAIYEASKSWAEEAKTDPEIGGEAFNANATAARGVFNKYVSDELRNLLLASGLTNHPDFIRMFVRLSKDLSGGAAPKASHFPNSRMG